MTESKWFEAPGARGVFGGSKCVLCASAGISGQHPQKKIAKTHFNSEVKGLLNISRSVSQAVSQIINQSVNQSINQSISQSVR